MRRISHAVIKAVVHRPRPYTLMNVSADVYCVYRNRTSLSAMRGFGMTGIDFAIACHIDRIAHAIGRESVKLRILNADRDSDIKAHRRIARHWR